MGRPADQRQRGTALRTTRRRIIGALAVAAVLAGAGIAVLNHFVFPDSPTDSGTQKQINDYLARYQHGQQTGPDEITFLVGTFNEFVITFRRAAGMTGPDCPAGWLCLNDGADFGYPRARFQTCGGVLLSWWGWNDRAESADHELIPKDPISPEARAGTVAFIATPAQGTNPQDYRRLFTLDDRHRTIADLGSSRNAVDFVYRHCA
jgi:hypothetical protein